jgi:hypothetical protein
MNRVYALVLAAFLAPLATTAFAEGEEATVATYASTAIVSAEAGAGVFADLAQNNPALLESTMRSVYAQVKVEDFDAMVDGAYSTLDGLSLPAEAHWVRSLAAKIKKLEENKGNALQDLPPEFLGRVPASGS